ncbi:hypothetical protein [Rhizobium skierniewicense]|nr:hypothetical protein [Rhizobium skierniewicense]
MLQLPNWKPMAAVKIDTALFRKDRIKHRSDRSPEAPSAHDRTTRLQL